MAVNFAVVSNEALLLALMSLTHKVHAAEAERDNVEAEAIRQQRHMVKTEILTRMEEGPTWKS